MKLVITAILATASGGVVCALLAVHKKRRQGSQLDADQPAIEYIQDLDTLIKVCQDPRSLAWVGSVTSVRVQNAGTRLGHLPPHIGAMTSLRSLDLSGSSIHHLPHFISNLVTLQELRMSKCQLNHIPVDISECHALTSVDLSFNHLTSIPDALCQLTSITTLNLMGNRLSGLPESLGNLTNLRLLGLKSNQLISLPNSFTRLTSLVELFITDNKLTTLPTGFGALKSLVKLQASFNHFTHLPDDVLDLPQLELMRVAVCQLGHLPPRLHDVTTTAKSAVMPKLAWCSLSGNGACAALPAPRSDLVTWSSSDVVGQGQPGAKLGDGASGEVFRAVLAATGEAVAVKQFRADVSPDGRTEEEVGIACAITHPHLTHVLGTIPSSQPDAPPLLVMKLVKGTPMAAKPTSQHLLRCKWDPEVTFSMQQTLKIAVGVASALAYLHSMNICHGDVYAHNILLDADTFHTTLCDFGASFVYHDSEGFWERMEVRAYGLFLKDVVERMAGGATDAAQTLAALVEQCTREPWTARPSFADIGTTLGNLRAE